MDGPHESSESLDAGAADDEDEMMLVSWRDSRKIKKGGAAAAACMELAMRGWTPLSLRLRAACVVAVQGAMELGAEEEIAQILLNMRVRDSSPAPSSAGAATGGGGSGGVDSGGRRYGTRTAAGLKVGRRYDDLLEDE
jgi:uncharacterized membrane protein YgcG